MMAEREKDRKKTGLQDRLKLSVSNDDTFEELWYIKLTKSNLFLLIAIVVFFLSGYRFSDSLHKPQGVYSRLP